jgi:hypothetical protein
VRANYSDLVTMNNSFEHTFYSDLLPASGTDSAFCWSKYGSEAGESSTRILDRKEQERRNNAGIFLWGIGSNVRRSLAALLSENDSPIVRFSAMRSKPKSIDVTPSSVVLWQAGEGIDGSHYELPAGSTVTSRASSAQHFALVCATDSPILETDQELNAGHLRNFVGNTRLGHSQVTSVVRANRNWAADGTSYSRGFTAQLTYPYLVRLTVGVLAPLPNAVPPVQGGSLIRWRDEFCKSALSYGSAVNSQLELDGVRSGR